MSRPITARWRKGRSILRMEARSSTVSVKLVIMEAAALGQRPIWAGSGPQHFGVRRVRVPESGDGPVLQEQYKRE